MKESKPGRKYRRKAYAFAFLTGAAMAGLFFQAWRVYAFDVRTAVQLEPRKATHGLVHTVSLATISPVVASPAPLAVTAKSPPVDRWSDGDVVGALSNFYQTIITYMSLLIGVMGVLAVITLRFFSKAAAEDMAHEAAKAAMQHYLETNKFQEVVSYSVQETGLASQLEFLERELVEIKRMLKARKLTPEDTSEDEEGTIDNPPEGGGS